MTTTVIPPISPPDFHRLSRLAQPTRWWRPLLVLLTASALFLALLVAPMLALIIIADLHPSIEPAVDQVLNFESVNNPTGLTVGLLMIILMLPASLLAVRLVGRRRAGTVVSVTGRLRWRLLGRASAITAVVLGVFTGVLLLVEPATGAASDGAAPDGSAGRLALMLVIVVLLVPWQAAAEEIVFRGLLAQTVGSWLRHPAWAILLPLPLFVFGHDYSLAGMLDVAVFAAVAGYLTWRTGGLEAAIGMHVVNNLGAFAIALFTGADLDATEVAPLAALISIAYTLVTAALILSPVAQPRRSASQRATTKGQQLLPVGFAPPQHDADQHGDLNDRGDAVTDHP